MRVPLTLFARFSDEPEADAYVTGEIKNRADLPLTLIEGEMLVGAKQNRTLNLSVLWPPELRR